MNILYYALIAIFAAAMLAGSFIACGHDGEKDGLIKYNNTEDIEK